MDYALCRRAAEGGSPYERIGAARRPKAFPAHGEGARSAEHCSAAHWGG